MGFGRTAKLAGGAAAAVAALWILGFYVARLDMPLPIFAGDEAAYLIRALIPAEVVAGNPHVQGVNNGLFLSLIRGIEAVTPNYIFWHRLTDAAAYLAGLLLLHRTATRGLPREQQIVLLLLAIGFPYYRFAFSNLPEGLYVGVLALFCVALTGLYRARPLLHGLLAGALAACLVLVKPHGLAVVAAFVALVVMDAAASRGWREAPARLAGFAATFFLAGNLIQLTAGQEAQGSLAFFLGDFYGGVLGAAPPPAAGGLGALAFGSMTSGMAVLAGIPAVVGLQDIVRRRRGARDRGASGLGASDLLFLLLLLSLAATLVMVTVFAMKVASNPGETKRLWGRYFEFYAPLIWFAAAPAMARLPARDRRTRLACALVLAAGVGGLLLSFRAGIVIFPWDASILLAFFHPDPERANLGVQAPYRALAVAASLLAALAMAAGVRPARVGLAHILALGLLSVHLDHVWLKAMLDARAAFARDIRAVSPMVPERPGALVLLTPDPNEAHLGFLRLDPQPKVVVSTPGEVPARELAAAEALLVGDPAPPPGDWVQVYAGRELWLYRPGGAGGP